MIWLLACTGGQEPQPDPPTGTAYEGQPQLTEASLECRGEDQLWTVSGRGVAELQLELSGRHLEGDTGDTALPAVDIDEVHPMRLSEQDPAGWWSVYELELQYAPEEASSGQSRASCPAVESELSWSLRLSQDGEHLDCLGECS